MTQGQMNSFNYEWDTPGRYCLNDLHKASGGEKRHVPAEFLRLDSTKELIEEIKYGVSHIPPVLSLRGFHGGTFVVKELVYAYAMWISPKFHLKDSFPPVRHHLSDVPKD